MIGPKRQVRIARAEQRKGRGRPFERARRRAKEKAARALQIPWSRREMARNAWGAICDVRRMSEILRSDPNAGLFVLARKGIVAEKALRIACEEEGIKMPQPVFMKASADHPTGFYEMRGEERTAAIDNAARVLAQHIKNAPPYARLKGKKTLILVDDITVRAGQVATFERALEIAFPNAKVETFLPFQDPQAGVPEELELKFPEQKGRIVEYKGKRVYAIDVDTNRILGDPRFKRWLIDFRREVRAQLKWLEEEKKRRT
ncbi:MAG: hypothetical protein NTW59_03450 [Candidatus Diapherotrites archaeon]|nr:hypothetical protein [Candidatus Diapherotrites archaeon]